MVFNCWGTFIQQEDQAYRLTKPRILTYFKKQFNIRENGKNTGSQSEHSSYVFYHCTYYIKECTSKQEVLVLVYNSMYMYMMFCRGFSTFGYHGLYNLFPDYDRVLYIFVNSFIFKKRLTESIFS